MSQEFNWINRYFVPLAGADSLGLQDDAALLRAPAGQPLIITTDTLNEDVHFKAGTAAQKIAQKALRVNLSDLAAKGASPLGYTLNLSLPESTSEAFIAEFCKGLRQDQTAFNVPLLGGDTTRTLGALSISITAFGAAKSPLLRSGAKAGDSIYVSGMIGAGYLGLHNHSAQTIQHYECPKPRLALGAQLVGVASACLDISDGLVQDLGHLCKASGVGAQIELASIPLADEHDSRERQLTGGDDYELLFTAPAGAAIPSGCSKIGIITHSADNIEWRDEQGDLQSFDKGGWQHF